MAEALSILGAVVDAVTLVELIGKMINRHQEYADQALSILARLRPLLDSIFVLRDTLEALKGKSLEHMFSQTRVQ